MRLKEFFRYALFILIIVLSVLEISQIAPGDMEFFKEILSWVLIGFFLYYLSPTKTLFNSRNPRIDILIIFAFYIFAFKNLVHSLSVNQYYLFDFLRKILLSNNFKFLNDIVFVIGSILIALLSIFLGFNVDYSKNSLLGWIRKGKKQRHLFDKIIDITIIYLILQTFSYFIFAIIMEWFALALDSYFVVVALGYYFLAFYVFKKKTSTKSFIEHGVETGEKTVKMFMDLFHNKKTIFYGISGIIVIHALVDIANFMIPYLFNITNTMYLSKLNPANHQTIISLLKNDLAMTYLFHFIFGLGWFQRKMYLLQDFRPVYSLQA